MAKRSTNDVGGGLLHPIIGAALVVMISAWSLMSATDRSQSTPPPASRSTVLDLVNVETESPPAGAPTTTATTTTALGTAAAVSDVNNDGNLRVLLVGDSLMWGAKDEITSTFADEGIEVEYLGYPGTGLLTAQTRWIDEIASSVATFAPDTVVIESCCNYQNDFTLPDGSTLAADSDLMYELWQTRTEQAIERAEAGGAQVFLVITPEAVDRARIDFPADRIERFNAIYLQMGVDLIDWNAALTDPDDPARSDRLHEDDGLHLTHEGYSVVAQATIARLLSPAL